MENELMSDDEADKRVVIFIAITTTIIVLVGLLFYG